MSDTALEYIHYRGDGWAVGTVTVDSDLRVGDVIRYTPERRHCREGVGMVYQRIPTEGGLAVFDTFWHVRDGRPGQDDHSLTEDELRTVEFNFRPSEYRELGQYEGWDDYSPKDRAVLSSQHGLSQRRFLRLGAEPDWYTRHENARQEVAEAEREIESANWRLDRARTALAEIVEAR